MNFFQKFREFIARPTHSRTMGILVVLVLVSAVSLTVYVAQQQQQLKQHAASRRPELPAGEFWCGNALDCTVRDNCADGEFRCHDRTEKPEHSTCCETGTATYALLSEYYPGDDTCYLVDRRPGHAESDSTKFPSCGPSAISAPAPAPTLSSCIDIGGTCKDACDIGEKYNNGTVCMDLGQTCCTAATPSKPTLISPANGAVGQSTTPTFSWDSEAGATCYGLNITGAGSWFTKDKSYQIPGGKLNPGTPYKWQVVAWWDGNCDTVATSTNYSISEEWSFKTISSAPGGGGIAPAPCVADGGTCVYGRCADTGYSDKTGSCAPLDASTHSCCGARLPVTAPAPIAPPTSPSACETKKGYCTTDSSPSGPTCAAGYSFSSDVCNSDAVTGDSQSCCLPTTTTKTCTLTNLGADGLNYGCTDTSGHSYTPECSTSTTYNAYSCSADKICTPAPQPSCTGTKTCKIIGETPACAPAAATGNTIIQLPAGTFSRLFTNKRSELIAHKDKSLTIYLYESTDNPSDEKTLGANAAKTAQATILSSGTGIISFDLGKIDPGTYKILAKSPQYLRALIVDNQTVTAAGGTIALNPATFKKSLADGAGDANNDNTLDSLDYFGSMLNCFGTKTCSNKEASDINDDGKVDEIDLNILTTSLNFAKIDGD